MLAPDPDELQRVAFPYDDGDCRESAEPRPTGPVEPWEMTVERLWPDGDDVPDWSAGR